MSFHRLYWIGLAWSVVLLTRAAASGAGDDWERSTVLFHGGVSGLFDGEKNPVLGLELRGKPWKAGLRPWIEAGWATDGAVFLGVGVARVWHFAGGWEIGAGIGPGYYERHEGVDLGSHLEFYSYGELARKLSAGRWISVRLAHISNGSLADRNPGTELLTLGCRFSLP